LRNDSRDGFLAFARHVPPAAQSVWLSTGPGSPEPLCIASFFCRGRGDRENGTHGRIAVLLAKNIRVDLAFSDVAVPGARDARPA
jgi:hypothetical protein